MGGANILKGKNSLLMGYFVFAIISPSSAHALRQSQHHFCLLMGGQAVLTVDPVLQKFIAAVMVVERCAVDAASLQSSRMEIA